jgi:type VI secretion system protein ImpG
MLRLELRCPQGALKGLELDRLRFFLNGDSIRVNTLYELLFTNVEKIAVLPGGSSMPYYLKPGAIKPVGFGLDEEVLPYPANAHPAYRLLQEYFYFPEKYHFFDLDFDLHRNLLRFLESKPESLDAVSTLEVFFLLRERPPRNLFVNADTFNLGCTPVINLFPKTTEPIRFDHRSLEYQLIADKRRESTTEIHSILSVSATSDPNKPAQNFESFYSYNHFMDTAKHRAFWHATRRSSNRREVPGTEMYLSFLDLNFKPVNPPVQTVYAHTLCTNRELTTRLPKLIQLHPEKKVPTHQITLVGKRSLPISPLLGGSTVWRLISHLSLNHLSLSEGGDSLNALREILGLYCVSNRPSTQDQINGITEMEIAKKSIYIGEDAWRGFRRGMEITLTFDEGKYRGSSAFILGAVLNSFFALYTSVNSFTKLRIKKRTQPDTIWKEWPPMAGEKLVL